MSVVLSLSSRFQRPLPAHRVLAFLGWIVLKRFSFLYSHLYASFTPLSVLCISTLDHDYDDDYDDGGLV